MSLTVEEGKGKFEPIPEGVHLAVCCALIDVGSQFSKKFEKWTKKVVIMWEIPSLKTVDIDGVAYTRKISREYTASLGEKTNLEKDLNSWRGKTLTAEERKGFALPNILGKGCQIQIIHKEREKGVYGEISSIMALPTGGAKLVEAFEEPYCFDLDDHETWVNFGKIPEWIQNKIFACSEYEGSELQKSLLNGGIVPNTDGFKIVADEPLPF